MRFSDFQIQTCPPVPPLPSDQVVSEGAKLMQAAGIQACNTDSSVAQFEAKAKVPFASAGIKASFAKTATVGCEQVLAISDKYNKTVQNVACMLKSSQNVTKKSQSGVNTIKFEAGKDLEIDCPEGFNIDQKMQLTLIDTIQLSDNELTQIANEVNDVVKSVADVVQESKTGLGATPQGSKVIKDAITNINQVDAKQNISQVINEINTTMTGLNEVLIKSGGNIRIKGKSCTISQDMVLQMIASTIVDNSVTNAFSSLSKSLSESDTKVTQKAENAGAEALALDLGDFDPKIIAIVAVVIIVIGYFGYKFYSGRAQAMAGMAGGMMPMQGGMIGGMMPMQGGMIGGMQGGVPMSMPMQGGMMPMRFSLFDTKIVHKDYSLLLAILFCIVVFGYGLYTFIKKRMRSSERFYYYEDKRPSSNQAGLW